VTNHAPSNPRIKPVNGLDTANQSGIASRNGSGARLRRRQGACFSVFTLIIFLGALIRRPIDSSSAKRVRAIQQAAIRKSRTSDNHHLPQPIRDARRARRRVSVAEVERRSGSHLSFSEERSFSWFETSALIRAPPFRVRRILQYHFRGDP
jgi:hypothetical protein